MRRKSLLSLATTGSLLISGCKPPFGFVHDEALNESYRLVAVDVEEDMMLCRAVEKGNCNGDDLPGPTVFAAGSNRNYIVLAVHPRSVGQINRAVTQYYYINRASGAFGSNFDRTMGPFEKSRYISEKRRLDLPEFTRVFENLH